MKSAFVQLLLCSLSALLLLAMPAVAMGSWGQRFSSALDCPVLGNGTPSFSICSGDNSRDLSVSTSSDNLDLHFVYFSAPQTRTSMYVGGTLLGTVSSSDFLLNGVDFDAVLTNVVFPTVSVHTVYYVYAIVDPNDPEVPDVGCRPFVEIAVRVNPNSGNISCNGSIQISLDEDGLVEVTPQMLLNGTYPE